LTVTIGENGAKRLAGSGLGQASHI